MRIAHIAVRVDDMKEARDFYEGVLGMTEVRSEHHREHYSCHLTDGHIDLSILQYDKGSKTKEALAAGEKPCIHHIGFEVDDLEEGIGELKERGYEIITEPGVIPVKFRAPGGTLAEIAPTGRFLQDAGEK
ncbi:VOC family protein [Alphaproteobacteria bacterium]|jgi:catechol 2,3-dioxygenase-like lactoylglutathione lyase family enzyme|nr:VOC family protein [Alphaproteobacteria bacterium]